MLIRSLVLATVGCAALLLAPRPAQAVLNSQDAKPVQPRAATGRDALQTRQYALPEARVAGQDSVRQSVTVWEVTAGSWNGQALTGLSLVLVRNVSDDAGSRANTHCYISHLASPDQRKALLNAYMVAKSLVSEEASTWRIEPAVIRVENTDGATIIHLGLVA